MTEPGTPSGWVQSDRRPSLGRWVLGCGLILVLVLAGVAVIAYQVIQSPFPRGLVAAAAIGVHGRPDVESAFYYVASGSEPVMQVILAEGVDSAVASELGCALVEHELAAQDLAGTHWTIYAFDRHPILDSEEADCSSLLS